MSNNEAFKADRLVTTNGTLIGFFRSGMAIRAAKACWNIPTTEVATYLQLIRIEKVDAGDGDRIEYLVNPGNGGRDVGSRVEQWLITGADRVEVSRFVVDCWVDPNGQIRGTGSVLVIRLTIKARS